MGLSIPTIVVPSRAAPIAAAYAYIGEMECDFRSDSGRMVLDVHYDAADADALLAPARQITIATGQVLVGADPTARVASVSVAGNVATVTTATAHGFAIGATVTLDGTTVVPPGSYPITAVTAYSFSFALTHADLASTPDSGSASTTAAAVTVSSLTAIFTEAGAYSAAHPGTTPDVAIEAALYAEFLRHPELVGSTTVTG